jgi:phage terminase large subunit
MEIRGKMKIQANVLFEEVTQKIQEGKRYISLRGSSRSGKTICAIQTIIIHCLTTPKSTITIARETQVSIKNTIFIDFKEQMEELQIWDDSRYNKVEMMYRFPNGSTIRFIGLDDTTGKLRGMKSDICLIDEVNTISMSAFIQLDIRTTNYILMCYNPEIPTDWWGLEYEKKENGCVLITTWRDNVFLEQRIIDSINSLKETDYDLWMIYSEGQIVPPREVVYQKPQVYEDEPQGIKQTYYGLDFGFARDVCAVVEVKVRDKELFIKEVLYEAGLTNEDLTFVLKDKGISRMENIVADSSEPKSIAELNRNGLNVRGVKKGAGSVLFGIQKLRQFKINVHKDSHNLITEFTNYRYKKDRQGRITNQTEGDDHALDALRYVVSEFLDTKPTKFTFV